MDKSSKGIQVEKTEKLRRNPLVYLNSLAIIISFFAMIVLTLFPFAVWWHSGLPGEIYTPVVVDFQLRFTSSSWFSIATLFLFFTFLLCLVMSIILLLNSVGKVSFRFPPRKIGLLGFIPSYAALTLTVTLTVVFIQYSINRPWHLSFCFYSSIFCSLILMLLFIIQLRGESIFRRSEIITQTSF
jgi:hypothetical protein